jgi:hypothetical protein
MIVSPANKFSKKMTGRERKIAKGVLRITISVGQLPLTLLYHSKKKYFHSA